MRSACLYTVIFAFAIFIVSPATAQFNQLGGQSPPQGERANVRGSGEIKGVQGNVIHVANGEGAQWLVKMPNEPQNVRLTGNATVDFLKPGLMVRFTGKFDSKGVSQAPIGEVEVFTFFPPRPGQRPQPNQEQPKIGVFPDQGLNAAELFGDADAEQPKTQIASFHVAGQLRGIRDGQVTVAAGPTIVHASVDADAAVTVETADLRWMRIGDTIEFDGWAYPQMKSQVFANRLRIKAKEKLGLPAAKPDAAPKTKPAGKNGEADPKLPF